MTEILGYLSAIVVGFTLGLIGGGGSILTVPVLVYVVGIHPVLATAYSLFVVGVASLAGSLSYMKKEMLSYKTAFVFAVPAFTVIFLTRKFLVPAIPGEIFRIGDFVMTKHLAVMVFFAVMMVLASVSMIHAGRNQACAEEHEQPLHFNYPLIMLAGIGVGLLTGPVGAGGGFLIIPTLVLLVRLSMKMAVGTSLLIIAANSLIGFLGDISEQTIDWKFLILFTGFAVMGIFMGTFTSKYVSGEKLKSGFGWFVLCMGIYIIARELLL